MAQQNINLGADGSGAGGDTGRTAFAKAQANFTDLYANKQDKSGLGNAAFATVMTSLSDGTAGRLQPVGAFGWGGDAIETATPDALLPSGAYSVASTTTWAASPFPGTRVKLLHIRFGGTTGYGMQIAQPWNASARLAWRSYDGPGGFGWGAWTEGLSTSNAAALPIPTALAANADNVRTLGTAALRWSTVYAGTGTINTSDAREKTEVRALTDSEITAARQLAQAIGAYKFLAAVAEKGADAREHIGLTVQRAIEILQANGLAPFNYGFICYDSWPQVTIDHPATYEQVPVTDVDGNVTSYENGALIKEAWTEVTQEAGDRYSFRTDELNLFIARGQAAYLAQLEARIAALEPAA